MHACPETYGRQAALEMSQKSARSAGRPRAPDLGLEAGDLGTNPLHIGLQLRIRR
jgi:hypothetical protein